MQTHDNLFTTTEAAVLTGLPLKAVNNAIDKKTISAAAGAQGGRLLDARALVSLSLERRLADHITPELRRKVFDALAGMPRNTVSLEGGSSRSTCANRAANSPPPCAICAGRGTWW